MCLYFIRQTVDWIEFIDNLLIEYAICTRILLPMKLSHQISDFFIMSSSMLVDYDSNFFFLSFYPVALFPAFSSYQTHSQMQAILSVHKQMPSSSMFELGRMLRRQCSASASASASSDPDPFDKYLICLCEPATRHTGISDKQFPKFWIIAKLTFALIHSAIPSLASFLINTRTVAVRAGKCFNKIIGI